MVTVYGRFVCGLMQLSATIVAISLHIVSNLLDLSFSETCNSPFFKI
jgi:hypothetical protein